MTITALPTFPTRDDPDNFDARVVAYLSALVAFTTEVNAIAADVDAAAATAAAAALTALTAPGTNGTSASAVAIGAGSKSWVTQTGKAWVPGMALLLAQTSAVANWMHGQITAYNSGTGALTVEVGDYNGAGAVSDWTISLAPPRYLGKASGADLRAGTSTSVAATPAALLAAGASEGVAFGSTVALDLAAAESFHLTTTINSNFSLANPSNMVNGRYVSLLGVVDATGGRTMTVGSKWKFPGGAPSIPTAPGSRFLITGKVSPDATEIIAQIVKSF